MANLNPFVSEGLDVHETKDGLIVYDLERNRVHYLNATAAVVFTLCDGDRATRAIADLVREAYDLDQAPIADVEGCLTQLRHEGLLR
jgi:hypothetical protein